MLITQLNAFLATAIGGFVFTLLAGTIKHLYSWLHNVKKDEHFLVDELNINAALIRLSLSNNKRNAKIYTQRQIIITSAFGTLMIIFSAVIIWMSASLLTNKGMYQVNVKHNKTNDVFIMSSGEAKNISTDRQWLINLESCRTTNKLEKINSIKKETKQYICDVLSEEQKNGSLPLHITKVIWANIIFTTILLLSGLWLLLVGAGALLDIYINKKIDHFNKKENEKSYQYLT